MSSGAKWPQVENDSVNLKPGNVIQVMWHQTFGGALTFRLYVQGLRPGSQGFPQPNPWSRNSFCPDCAWLNWSPRSAPRSVAPCWPRSCQTFVPGADSGFSNDLSDFWPHLKIIGLLLKGINSPLLNRDTSETAGTPLPCHDAVQTLMQMGGSSCESVLPQRMQRHRSVSFPLFCCGRLTPVSLLH